MTKTISPALLAAYAGSSNARLTICIKATRTDGMVFGYTALDKNLVVQGITYLATVGVTSSAIAASASFDVQNLELSGILNEALRSSGAMTEEDVIARLWDSARVTIFECNANDTTQGVATLQTGTFGQISTGNLTFKVELRGLMQKLQQSIGHSVQVGCWKDFLSPECIPNGELNPADFTFNGTVAGVFSTHWWSDPSLAKADHYFQYGLVTWLTGLNAGLQMEVKDYANVGDVQLQMDMPNLIQVGDTYTIRAGCNKMLKTEDFTYGPPINGSVTGGIKGANAFQDTAKGQDDHFWDAAKFAWVTGYNVGVTCEVQNFIGQSFTLLGSMPFAIQSGDEYTVQQLITTGDSVYNGDCKKHNNVLNFGGCCETPGNDKTLGAGNNSGSF